MTFADNRVVIGRRIETENAQTKPILPLRLSVASTRITTRLGKDWNDLIPERNRRWIRNPVDPDRDVHGEVVQAERQR